MTDRASKADEVCAAAYRVFCRVGFRAASISDVAAELGRTRPVIYKVATGKEDLFRLVAQDVLGRTLARAELAAHGEGSVGDRVTGVLTAKLDMAAKLHADSPHHAAEFLNESSQLIRDLVEDFTARIGDLVREVLEDDLERATARKTAAILTAVTRGLEDDVTAPDKSRRLLATAVSTFLLGVAHTKEKL